MNKLAITIKTIERPGVLSQITNMIALNGINITYTHLFVEKDGAGSIYMELEEVKNVNELVSSVESAEPVIKVEIHRSLNDIYGKTRCRTPRRLSSSPATTSLLLPGGPTPKTQIGRASCRERV